MDLRRRGEDGFIAWIGRRFGRLAPPPPAGIGDDAALRRMGGAALLTTDCLVEGVHFRRDEPAFLLGRKSLAVNLSDIAAMGGRPDCFLMVLAVPDDLPSSFLGNLIDGMASAAREHGVALAGGDTSRSAGPLVIAITVAGRTQVGRGARVLTRSGARPGDGIYVSGALGDSAAGRRLLDLGWRPRPAGRAKRQTGAGRARVAGVTSPAGGRGRRLAGSLPPIRARQALGKHLDPQPQLALGRWLLSHRVASAAIDLSDGLSTDLARLTAASRVGARLLAPAVPIGDPARAVAAALGEDPLGLALHGGEDYELLFTVPAAREPELLRLPAGLPGAFFIGRITSRLQGIRLAEPSGRDRPLRAGGFDHFLTSR
ncbi:MAG TPA: thiamine-phosphate kinase [Candidatus Polarisedimenticolia bacterium]|nr:thiamine-phosphate kinase [Candidatus Polarisedimenticolia bacterium]